MTLAQAKRKGDVKHIEFVRANFIGSKAYQAQFRVHYHNKSPVLAFEYVRG
jgi:hypothetical protein